VREKKFDIIIYYLKCVGAYMFELIILFCFGLSILIPVIMFNKIKTKSKKFKFSLMANILLFFAIMTLSSLYIFSKFAFAAASIDSSREISQGLGYLGAGLVTGLSTVGAGIATGSAASAALGAVSENEKFMGKALIFVALAEGIAIYGLLISFTILGRI